MNCSTAPQAAASVPEGYMADAKGRLVPERLVKPADRLEDQTVRTIMGYAEELSAQIARFKGHTFDDVYSLIDLINEQYGVQKGGRKGNITLTTFDGCQKVQVAVADRIVFGPSLQAAKKLVDECIASWSEGAHENLRALVDEAFAVDKEGHVNRERIFGLRRLAIEDERWKRAVEAIDESVRVIGSTVYVRFYRRPAPDAPWQAVTIDLASA